MINISGVIANHQRMIIENSKDCCGNCCYYNGDIGDGIQFCDEKETDVSDKGYCYKHKRK